MSTLKRCDDLRDIHDALRARIKAGLKAASARSLDVVVFETIRDPARQDWLYQSGRTRIGKIVTNARPWQSWHQYGLAVDLVFDKNPAVEKVEYSWSGAWQSLGEIMEGQGLEWLGNPNSKFKEFPHFQLTAGLTIGEASQIHMIEGRAGVWAEITKRLERQKNDK